MFIVFEGIDGSGKTTVSNLVAQRLRDAGHTVEHVREGGTFASRVTQALRELGRDSRNLALTPRAELMLYLTREVQLLEEATRPALQRAEIVIADRFVATAQVLAVAGRGLPASEVEPLVAAAVSGMRPDLTILVDVDPRIARARRRVSKLLSDERKPPSRKGMAGPALQRRLREGYRELAGRDDRWVVVDNTNVALDATVDHVLSLIDAARTRGVNVARKLQHAALAERPHAHDVASARARLLEWIDERAAREPGLAAYFLDGLYGADFDERRLRLAAQAPRVIAAGLKYLIDDVSWQLRRDLAGRALSFIARSIAGPAASNEGDALLAELSDAVPFDVGAALRARDDARAWDLRAKLTGDALVQSLGGVTSDRAWPLREAWLAGASLEDPHQAALACASIEGVAGDRAWQIRKAARHHAPVAALESLYGLDDDRAWKWRERHLERAPKVVIGSIALLTNERAWALRARVSRSSEEVMDSIVGLDDERAWQLRESVLDLWPSAAVKSLGAMASDRANALITRALEHAGTDVSLWRQVVLATQRS